MTLPFRRRHNDHETSHDRARALIATGYLQPNEPVDADWLEAHLAGCLECRNDHAAYGADRELLRALREQAPEPPRDLWARTAAAIELEAGRRTRNQRRGRPPRSWRIGHLPAGVASGLLVVLVVVGASLVPRGGVQLGPTAPAGSDVAVGTPRSEATPLAVLTERLAWIQVAEDGTFEFRQASVNEVCPDLQSRCAPLDSAMTTSLAITQAPQAVLLSPTGSETGSPAGSRTTSPGSSLGLATGGGCMLPDARANVTRSQPLTTCSSRTGSPSMRFAARARPHPWASA